MKANCLTWKIKSEVCCHDLSLMPMTLMTDVLLFNAIVRANANCYWACTLAWGFHTDLWRCDRDMALLTAYNWIRGALEQQSGWGFTYSSTAEKLQWRGGISLDFYHWSSCSSRHFWNVHTHTQLCGSWLIITWAASVRVRLIVNLIMHK